MIINIPEYKDFQNTGIELLNHSWGNVTQHLEPLFYGGSVEDEEGYWESLQQRLSIALSLCHQGIEFLLKAKIAAVSPFLLLNGHPKDWPKKSEKEDKSFSEFRTIDAQDLIKVHDSVSSPHLPKEFIEIYGKLRKKRNTFSHSINKTLKVSIMEILAGILETSNTLITSATWPLIRREFLENDEHSYVAPPDLIEKIYNEFDFLVDQLSPSDSKRLLNFDKKRRRYLCPECSVMCQSVYEDTEVDLAFLEPNTPSSSSIFCLLCGGTFKVSRSRCTRVKCKGNVIYTSEKMCLTCGD